VIELALIVLLVGAIGWLLYLRFGPQVLGVPAMIGVFAVFAVWEALSTDGVIVIAAVILGVLAVWMIIGMALTIGRDEYVLGDEDKPRDDL
jgi:hypothetical protein